MCSSRQELVGICLLSGNFSIYMFGKAHSRCIPILWCSLQTLTFISKWQMETGMAVWERRNPMPGAAVITLKVAWKPADHPTSHPYLRLSASLPWLFQAEELSVDDFATAGSHTAPVFTYLGCIFLLSDFPYCSSRTINLMVGALT